MLKKILLTGLLAAAVALAQRGGGGGGSGGGMGGESMGGMGGGGYARVDRLDTITSMMKLSKDQKKMVKSTLDEGQKEAAPVRDQLAKDRKAIAEAVLAGGQDGLATAVKNYAAAEAQMTTIELKAFAKIYATLDKEQQQGSRDFYSRILPGMFKGKSWNE